MGTLWFECSMTRVIPKGGFYETIYFSSDGYSNYGDVYVCGFVGSDNQCRGQYFHS